MNPSQMPELDDLIEVLEADELDGWCTNCCDWTLCPIEPDARNVECPECGKNTVFGAQELLFHIQG